MGFLASLFGGGKITEQIVSSISSGIDSAFYTDQEKAEANQKILDFKLEWVKATQGQNIARRLVALAVTVMWMLCGLIVLIAKGLGADAFSQFALAYLTDVVTRPFEVIIGFYFLAHVARAVVAGKSN